MSTYEPGTVAMVTVKGKTVLALRGPSMWATADWYYDRSDLARDCEVTDVRPLVALDPATIPDLRGYLPEMSGDYDHDDHRLVAVIREIEAQTKPPKPAEPTGLGAVVEDAEGRKWVRTHGVSGSCVWHDGAPDTARVAYSRINAVRVLSEGVS